MRRGHLSPPLPPPLLPPQLPQDALESKEPASPPPCLPASMPLAPAPVMVLEPEIPAPPSQPPGLPQEPALRTQDKEGAAKSKLSLPCKILRFDHEILQKPANAASEAETADSFLSGVDEETPSFAKSRMGNGVKFPPGLQPPPNTPSHGSVLHGDGGCRPCAWFWKSSGCENGPECGHCHMCPEGEIKSRKKAKQTIMRLGLATPKVAKSYEDEVRPRELPSFGVPEVRESHIVQNHEIDILLAASPACAPSDFDSTCAGTLDYDCLTTGTCSEHESHESHEQDSDGSHSERSASVVNFPPGLEHRIDHDKVVPSKGSALHSNGVCRPCAWFWKPTGCQNGTNCKYCHACPDGEIKSRKKTKLTVMRLGLVTPKAAKSEPKEKYSLSLASLLT